MQIQNADLYIANEEDKRTTRKIRRLASAELCATSKYEVVGYLSRCIVASSFILIIMHLEVEAS